MLTVRLPEELEHEIDRLATEEKTTKTQIIRRALERYLETQRNRRSAYELGESLFGKYGSGESDRSTTYKQRIREKISAKHSR